MNYEENRLNTFTNWPTSAEVEPIRIAKAGFYYTGQGVEVQCFSCGGKISEWNYGDQVMARHRRLDPNCPFVVNPQSSGNVALVLDQHSRPSGSDVPSELVQSSIQRDHDYIVSDDEEDVMYRNDALRLLSFINWPVSYISRESLVNAGLYHAGEGRVRCAWCGGELSGWRPGDDPLQEHVRRFPHCRYAVDAAATHVRAYTPDTDVPNYYTPPLLSPPSRDEQPQQPQTEAAVHNARVLAEAAGAGGAGGAGGGAGGAWRALGVVGGAEGARHPARAALAARLGTFARWPADRAQSPQALADAGFFYTGAEDRVRCFYCDGGLGMWEVGDTPWNEHAHWFPECGYVLLVKGRDFVEKCKNKNPVQRTFSADAGLSARRLNMENHGSFPVMESQVEEQMEGPEARAALGAGLDAARVRRALARRLRATGVPYSSSEALIDAVLDDQLNEEPWSSSPQNRRLARDILADTFREFAPGIISLSPWAERSDNSDHTESRGVSPALSAPQAAANSQNDNDVNDLINRMLVTNNNTVDERNVSDNRQNVSTETRSESNHTPSDNTQSTEKKELSLEEENRQLKEARLCKVCMDSEVSVVFLPCGHLVSCAGCGASLVACPLCRATVRALVRAYLA